MLPIHMGLFKFWFLHLKYEKDYEKIKKKINHIPIKQVWLKKKYYIDRRCTNMGGSKISKNYIEKKKILKYIKGSKFKNWVVQKMKRLT